MHQYSVGVNNARLDAVESTIGTAPLLKFYDGTKPANCAASPDGDLLDSQALPSDWMAAASSAIKAKAGTWSGTYGADGTVRYWRIYDSTDTTCHMQGLVFPQVQLVTDEATSENGNVLVFTDTTGVAVGMTVSGDGIPAGAYVVDVDSTTVTLSHTSTAGVEAAKTITFGGDMVIDNPSAANGQAWTVNSFQLEAGNK
jgi:hypothetical protein